ncbi:MAG: hypothetical protein QF652_07980 [Dehalococcoidia bacterium]|jgi:hypothetical protein|nr:hypothetical protein [Dehalococcoidia bacterium]
MRSINAAEPATLDLVERAEYAINAMTRCTNPDDNYAVYFGMAPDRRPAVLSDRSRFYGKFMEATALARRMTSSDVNRHVDRAWHGGFMAHLRERMPLLGGPDGERQLAWLAIRQGDFAYFGPEDRTPDGWAATFGPYFPDQSPVDTVTGMPTGWAAIFQGWSNTR